MLTHGYFGYFHVPPSKIGLFLTDLINVHRIFVDSIILTKKPDCKPNGTADAKARKAIDESQVGQLASAVLTRHYAHPFVHAK
jgi:hypothetical protein